MTTEKHYEEIYYVNICENCGNEFRVSKNSTVELCYNCQTEDAIRRAKEKLAFLIDAKIINVEPVEKGHCTGSHEIENIEVESIEGKRILFRIGGYNEHYIAYEEEGEEEKEAGDKK